MEIEDVEEAAEDTSRRTAAKKILVARAEYSGPLPAPHVLAEYGQVMPGLPEKIVRMTEREQEHRHGLEREELAILQEAARSEARRLMTGQIGGLCFAAFLIAAGIWFGYHDKFIAMGIVLVPTLFEAISHLLHLPRHRRRPPESRDR